MGVGRWNFENRTRPKLTHARKNYDAYHQRYHLLLGCHTARPTRHDVSGPPCSFLGLCSLVFHVLYGDLVPRLFQEHGQRTWPSVPLAPDHLLHRHGQPLHAPCCLLRLHWNLQDCEPHQPREVDK